MSERIRIDLKAGVADVRLHRPEKMNAIDPPMFEALAEAGRSLALEPGLRAVVLSGEGRAFCAGLDMASFAAMSEERPEQQGQGGGGQGGQQGCTDHSSTWPSQSLSTLSSSTSGAPGFTVASVSSQSSPRSVKPSLSSS